MRRTIDEMLDMTPREAIWTFVICASAAMMFLIHGEAATYQVGWTSDQGRELNAHHLILWRAVEELRERGVRVLDLGGVNTIRSAGVARFKMRTGGKVLTLAGTYI